MRHELQDFLAVPAVVAARQDVYTHRQQLFRQPRRNPEARGRILAVGDHKIDLTLRNDVGKPLADDLPPRRPNNVSNKKYAHAL